MNRIVFFFCPGILSSRFRILFIPLDASPDKAVKIVHATCVLHNMLCSVKDNIYNPPGYADVVLPGGIIVDGFWRQNNQLADMRAALPRRHTESATYARNTYMEWCSKEGMVDWQDNHINRTH